MRGPRSARLVAGVAVLSLVWLIAVWLQLPLLRALLGVGFTYGALALLVIFQPELRAALVALAPTRLALGGDTAGAERPAEELADAVDRLARAGHGAIIVVERETPLDEWLASGTPLDAAVSAELLASIFTPYGPLHDGAVVVRGARIVAAGVILPLAQSAGIARSLGTRHLAALGLSEESDAIVLVVSEERGTIAVAMDGLLRRDVDALVVRDLLRGDVGEAAAVPSVPRPVAGARG